MDDWRKSKEIVERFIVEVGTGGMSVFDVAKRRKEAIEAMKWLTLKWKDGKPPF